MSLATRYRPRTFDQVVGQLHITDILQAHIHAHHTQKKNATNYLLYGPRGTGKTSSARILAKALNCLDPQEGNPCNTCENCLAIQQEHTMDIIEIDAASHTGVDNIREEIIEKAAYKPAQLPFKVYIIDEVHMLSKGAFNALLKIMEEPGKYLRFILATTEIHKVPDTIISRCQVFHFKRIASKAMVAHLEDIASQEGITTEKQALTLIATMSEGCMRDAVKYMEQVSIVGDISTEHVTSFLGIAPLTLIQETVEDIIIARETQDYEIVLTRIQTLQDQGIDLQQLSTQLMDYIDDHIHEDPEKYSLLAQKLYTIVQDAKRHPHIGLLYKSGLYSFVHPHTETAQSTSSIEPNKSTKSTKTKTNTPEPQSKNNTPTNTAHSNTTKHTANKQTNKQADPVQPNQKDTQDTNQDSQTQSQTNHNDTEQDWSQLTQKFINAIDRGSLQGVLQDQSKITGRTGTIVHMVIINPAAKLQVNKPAIREQLEQTLSEILGAPHSLEFTHMSKDDFFATYL